MAKGLIEIKFDERKLRQITKQMRGYPGALPRVMSRAINRTANQARTQIARKISSQVQVSVSDVRRGVRIDRATRTKWQADLQITGFRTPLIKFGARQTKTGISYIIDKSTGRKRIDTAFIATMPSGHKGVFKRKGKSRLPIVELRGASIGVLFENTATVATEVTRDALKQLSRNIDTQVALILERNRRAA